MSVSVANQRSEMGPLSYWCLFLLIQDSLLCSVCLTSLLTHGAYRGLDPLMVNLYYLTFLQWIYASCHQFVLVLGYSTMFVCPGPYLCTLRVSLAMPLGTAVWWLTLHWILNGGAFFKTQEQADFTGATFLCPSLSSAQQEKGKKSYLFATEV